MTRLRIAAFVAALAWSTSALAQEAEPYVAKFNEGRALVKANKYAEALDKFKESSALKPASGTYLNIGDCYEHLGRYASAMEAFEKALELASENKQPEREKEASDRAGKLQAIVSSITVTSSSKELKVTVDGQPAIVGQAFSVDGGPHVVHVEASCKRPKDIPVSVGMKSDTQSIAVDPATLEADPACGPKPEPQPAMSTQRLLSYVAGGAGIVSLGVGVGFGLIASGHSDDLEGLCPTYPSSCPPGKRAQIDEAYDDASTAATVSTIGFVGAIAFIGAGVALYILSPEWQSSQRKVGWVPGRFTF